MPVMPSKQHSRFDANTEADASVFLSNLEYVFLVAHRK